MKREKALKKSIKHWKRMRDFTYKKLCQRTESPVATYCALCTKYLTKKIGECSSRCPVVEKTGKGNCYNTPWGEASSLYNLAVSDPAYFSAWKKAAQKEIDFLESLS